MTSRMANQPPRHLGTAGGSASLKAQRLREQRQARQASRSGLGRLAATLFEPGGDKRLRQEERNWTTGADGEHDLAGYLARRCPDVPMLHDRRAPASRGNIDHIAIAPSGVYVIDCKRYKGKIEVSEPLFGKAKLKINGRDQTKLIAGLDKQVSRVRTAIAEIAPDVPIHGCLCFVTPEGFLADSGLPLLRTLKLGGYPLYYPRRLAKRLNQSGTLEPDRAARLQAELAERLPEAAHS
ncbi:MAG TPA: nuclease-related domain-containing protein [Solirubrobacteraceae bacterium]|nr:nuclease-related domain-containing protein [Solirubrobacteraceae bacterium]